MRTARPGRRWRSRSAPRRRWAPRSGRRRARHVAPDDHDRRADPEQHQGDELRLGEPRHHVVVAAYELHQEALDARNDQVDPEQHTRSEAVAEPPQHVRREAHRERLVDGRGVHLVGGRDGAVRIGHGPREVRLDAVVPVARELAADAPHRVPRGERHGGDVEQLPAEEAAPPRPEDHAERAAHQPAEPHKAGPGEDVAEQVVGDVVPVLEDEVEPRADQSADQRREDHLVGPVGRVSQFAKAATDDQPGYEEGEREADPERLKLERADVNLGLHLCRKLAGGRLRPYHGGVRRAVLAVFLCAAPLLAATAQASTGMVERVALREALRQDAHASGNGVVRLPLPEAPRVSAAAARRGLARLASSPGPEHLLVGVRSHGDVDGVAAKLRALGAEPERFDTIAVLAARVPSAADAIAALRDDARVAYVERDEPLRVAVEPFDISDFDTGRKFSWAYDAVRAGEALAAVGGGSARTVSVIDTGLDVTHPEFAGQVQRVFDTEAENTNVTDIVGHGTFVTGLIAARDGNSIGGKGVAGTTKVLAVRASRDREGRFSLADLINGIEFSIRRGADVINMSLAGTSFTRSHARALEAAFFNDVLPVAASGNNAENGNPLEFPAAAIGGGGGGRGIGLSVAATKPDGGVASFSNHNAYVSLAAPGASQTDCRFGVFSTIPSSTDPPWDAGGCPNTFTDASGSRFAYGEGTSFAAPIVSGLASLAWQAERP